MQSSRKNKPIVSIAMAAYNGEKFIKEQLESFSKQTVVPDEVVICDDCSKDATLQIIENYAPIAHYKIKIIKNSTNIASTMPYGYGQTFSLAAQNCSGDYIFYSDQDDVWSKNKIERHLEIYESNPDISFITTRAENANEDLTQNKDRIKANFNDFVSNKFVMGCCSSGKKEFFKYILPIPKGCSHDWWATICACSLNCFTETNEKLQLYRLHRNQTSSYSSKQKKNFITKLRRSISAYTQDTEYTRLSKEVVLWELKLTGFRSFYEKLKSDGKTDISLAETYLRIIEQKFYLLDLRYKLRNKTILKRLLYAVINFKHYNNEYHLFRAVKYALKDIIAPDLSKLLSKKLSWGK